MKTEQAESSPLHASFDIKHARADLRAGVVRKGASGRHFWENTNLQRVAPCSTDEKGEAVLRDSSQKKSCNAGRMRERQDETGDETRRLKGGRAATLARAMCGHEGDLENFSRLRLES